MGLTGCPRTLVTKYQSMLCNIPEKWRFHLHCGISLKSRTPSICFQGYTLCSNWDLLRYAWKLHYLVNMAQQIPSLHQASHKCNFSKLGPLFQWSCMYTWMYICAYMCVCVCETWRTAFHLTPEAVQFTSHL
jgi:hypothetical protein